MIEEFRPHEAAVEATFVNANAVATLKLGQARGIAMLVPAKAGLSVAEYAPNLVKKSIVGAGHGEKAQIRMMIGVLLPQADPQIGRRRRRAGDRGLPRASSQQRIDEGSGAMICGTHSALPPPERGRVGVGVNFSARHANDPHPPAFTIASAGDLPLAGGGKKILRRAAGG